MSNTYTDEISTNPILNFYSSESQLTSQANPSATELHMIPAGGVSLPSNTRYIDFTLPASLGSYTAPADGWISLMKVSGDTGKNVAMISRVSGSTSLANISTTVFSTGTANDLSIFIPVTAGALVNFYYSASGTTKYCRFIYANGAPNVSAS